MSLAYPLQSSAARHARETCADAIERLGLRMSFAKDEEIYAQDEEADLIYRVVSGVVRTSRLMSDGRRQVGDFYYPGDIFGLEPGDEHRYSAEALSDCVVLVLKQSALRTQSDDEALARVIWEATARELERAQEHVMLLGRKSAFEKVASFLSDITRRGQGHDGDLPMSRQDIADYLGLTIETVSRTISKLQSAAIIEFEGCRHFRVRNDAALARLAE
ncbi:MAG: helix-turn-helix domain-containing protein [Phenylobacterium sp.]|uniref:helix-turn-helix domain-containing protein n=1 Tax=Phenylobacterium sp. TaxID=1871053 RepID=UPI003918E360